ncbi:PspC domain-containing protein [Williamsia sterculiae]|nr:PspC domain-containing protein [Williamsia sterculiae]
MNQQQLENMWRTRPARPRTGSTVAGVCAGVGARYRVDPTLVKVAFIVATVFGGSGVLLYIAAWLTCPQVDGPDGLSRRDEYREIRDRFRSRRNDPQWRSQYRAARREFHRSGGRHWNHGHPPTLVMVVLIIIVTSAFTPNVAWSGGLLVGAALMLFGWYLLYQRTPEAAAGTGADTVGQAAESVTAPLGTVAAGVDLHKSGVSDATATNTPPSDPTTPQPPAWDPLGVAPFAWDLPEPTPAEPQAPAGSRALAPIVVGAAVVLAAAATAAAFTGVGFFTPARVVSVALLVVGVGLLIGSVGRGVGTRRGTVLVPVALIGVLAVIGLSTLAGLHRPPSGGVGERMWKPLSENDLRDTYGLTVGSATLDLRSVPLTRDHHVAIDLGAGEIKILVPDGLDVQANCSTGVGDQECPDGIDPGRDGVGGPVLHVDASTDVGQIQIIRNGAGS